MLSCAELRIATVTRCGLWHADGLNFRTLDGWFGAVAGEVGEMLEAFSEEQGHRMIAEGELTVVGDAGAVAQAVKAQRTARRAMMDELADVIIYLDLFAAAAGFEVRDPGTRYAPMWPDVAFPRAAYLVLKIGDTLHKMERSRRDGWDAISRGELEDRLQDQINHAFVALKAAGDSINRNTAKAVVRKFNATSAKKGLPVTLELLGGEWRAVVGLGK